MFYWIKNCLCINFTNVVYLYTCTCISFAFSAGVGRTGTIIALDMCLDQLQHEETVDVRGVVAFLREQRSQMIQVLVSACVCEYTCMYMHVCMYSRHIPCLFCHIEQRALCAICACNCVAFLDHFCVVFKS